MERKGVAHSGGPHAIQPCRRRFGRGRPAAFAVTFGLHFGIIFGTKFATILLQGRPGAQKDAKKDNEKKHWKRELRGSSAKSPVEGGGPLKNFKKGPEQDENPGTRTQDQNPGTGTTLRTETRKRAEARWRIYILSCVNPRIGWTG